MFELLKKCTFSYFLQQMKVFNSAYFSILQKHQATINTSNSIMLLPVC